MKGVQCYELFGGIALKNHAFFLDLNINIFNANTSYFTAEQFANTVHDTKCISIFPIN